MNLLIAGFGGHARSVGDLALTCGYKRLLFVDANAAPDETFLDHPAVQSFDQVDQSWQHAFAASGNGQLRERQCKEISERLLKLVTLISPTAYIGRGAVIGPGCFIGHQACVGALSTVGQASIINTGATVEHESFIGDYSHVSINSCVGGRSRVGAYCMLGAGAVVIDAISISDRVTIGAGAAVIDSIALPGTYVGVPTRRLG